MRRRLKKAENVKFDAAVLKKGIIDIRETVSSDVRYISRDAIEEIFEFA